MDGRDAELATHDPQRDGRTETSGKWRATTRENYMSGMEMRWGTKQTEGNCWANNAQKKREQDEKAGLTEYDEAGNGTDGSETLSDLRATKPKAEIKRAGSDEPRARRREELWPQPKTQTINQATSKNSTKKLVVTPEQTKVTP